MTVLSDEYLLSRHMIYFGGVYEQEKEQRIIECLRAVADAAVDADRAGRGEPVYAFRRRGIDDFCTCTKQRYDELASKPKLFEVAVFYTYPPLDASKAIVPEGYVVLPDTATHEMRRAGNKVLGWLNSDNTMTLADRAHYIYEAMLAAAQPDDVDEKNQLLLAGIDANLLGFGYIVDGRRVHPSKIKVVVNAAHEAKKAGGA